MTSSFCDKIKFVNSTFQFGIQCLSSLLVISSANWVQCFYMETVPAAKWHNCRLHKVYTSSAVSRRLIRRLISGQSGWKALRFILNEPDQFLRDEAPQHSKNRKNGRRRSCDVSREHPLPHLMNYPIHSIIKLSAKSKLKKVNSTKTRKLFAEIFQGFFFCASRQSLL